MGNDREDVVLVEKAGSGDDEAFNTLIAKYQGPIFQFCLRMLHNAEEAEELTQDVFVRLYRNLKLFRGDSKFSTWLFQIAKNLTLNRLQYLRRRQFFKQLSLDDTEKKDGGEGKKLDVTDEKKRADTIMEDSERRREIQRNIEALPPDYRTVLIMRDVEERSYAEIAEAMGVAEGTVKSRIHRARAALRSNLSDSL
jgi:RNA polymerase sigma-70 factor, ECF subfamily